MGQAKRRGTYEDRKAQAIAARESIEAAAKAVNARPVEPPMPPRTPRTKIPHRALMLALISGMCGMLPEQVAYRNEMEKK